MALATKVYEIDPLHDERWPEFLRRHPSASIFHTPEWLCALHRTYGYKPGAVTTTAPKEPLTNALLFCRVRSWLTGRRLVSVPFSDHCAPLVECDETLNRLVSHLKPELDRGSAKYLEIRSSAVRDGMSDSASFCLHHLDLRPSLDELFHRLHANCIRRKIARAQREQITCKEGTSEDLLREFYQLTVLTRRRHYVLPQPLSWFRNLLTSIGSNAKIRIAYCHGEPAAAIFTIRYKTTMVYKYGCSDARFHRLGPMQLLMWKVIEEAKRDGFLEFDMGRTDWDNPGLLAFKDRWGCTRSTLTYLRYSAQPQAAGNLSFRFPTPVFTHAPSILLATAGGLLYRHIG